MWRTRTVRSLVVAATCLAVTPLCLPTAAEAHGFHGGVHFHFGFGGFYGWGPYWGWGWPYWGWGWGPGPYYYGGGVALGYAMMSGLGALDVNVKPNQAEVWVDGKYVADARDLDGDPSYLWLKDGPHHVVLYKAGFRSFEEDVDVHTGIVRELKVRLEKGESQPPVRAPSSIKSEPPRAESAEPHAEAAEPRGEPGSDVMLRVQPGDAAVYVDGKYRGTARQLQGLRLPAGHHRVELARPGYQSLVKEFDVEAGRPIALELRMERGGGWKY